jgi:PAS domain S-box-containing protein
MRNLGTRFLLPLGVIAILFSTFVLYEANEAAQRHAKGLIDEQARLALQFNLAVRRYAGTQIRPVMESLVAHDEFIPETMSTSFISRAVFEMVRQAFPEYVIRFPSEYPRNPLNTARPDELRMLAYFKGNPTASRKIEEIEINGRPYLAHLTPRWLTLDCMRCHGDPKDAPAALIQRYGDTASFNRKPGDLAGIDMVAIPFEAMNAVLAKEMRRQSLTLTGGLVLLFGLILLAFRFVVTRRLAFMARHFNEIADHPSSSWMKPVEVGGNDEITVVGAAFNRLLDQLRDSHASLEQRVEHRTEELRKANEQLQSELAERKRAEEMIQESEKRFKDLYDNAPVGYHEYDHEGRITQVNRTELDMLGYTPEEMVGRFYWEFTMDPERARREILAKLTGALPPVRETERTFRRKDGSTLTVLISNRLVLDDQGRITGIRSTVQDITLRKTAEEENRKLQTRLQRAEKMEALGTLAGGVAHDLNNILSGIVSYPDLLLMQLPEDSPFRRPVVVMQESGMRAAAIVQDLLTLARRAVPTTEVVSLNAVITEYLKSPEHERLMSFHPNVRVETHFDDALLNILGSPLHLSKTIMNLISNAAEAMPGGGTVFVTTENRYVDSPIAEYDHVEQGDYVTLTVSDTGIGISAADRNRIFEPFYTKKVMGRSGTGLGMAVVWGTVKDHKGYIDVQSVEGKGTTFTLYFPVTLEERLKALSSFSVDAFRGKGESILVVDDVEGQREIASALLSHLGYCVSAVSSGEEAVRYLSKTRVDLILLDMVMEPGIDGLETYRRILRFHPLQKAVIASGFSETLRVGEVQRLGAGPYLRKPYTLARLAEAVRNELDKP